MPRRKPKTPGVKPSRDVNAAARAAVALSLALEGHTYQAIANQAGYASKGAAFNAIQRELERTLQPATEAVRRMEVNRMDALLTVYFPKAMAGDGWSMDRVLRIMERRAGLLGLDAKSDALGLAGQVLIRRYDADVEAV